MRTDGPGADRPTNDFGSHHNHAQFLGIDVGAETVRVVGLRDGDGSASLVFSRTVSHRKAPQEAIRSALAGIELREVRGVAATGRLSRVLKVPQVPIKAALRRGVRMIHPELDELTLVSIGAHGFSVLELRASGQEHFQQNSRCSQGTGNFLTQLVERFGLTVAEASELCAEEQHPAALSGRCPVILKTDMTHLANKGEDKAKILAGLYDAVCENVVTLIRPRQAPTRVVLTGGVTRSSRIRSQIGLWLTKRDMHLVPPKVEDEVLEALGAASHSMETKEEFIPPASLDALFTTAHGTDLERVPALRESLAQVKRMPPSSLPISWDWRRSVLFGLDIGSTGSKSVVVDAGSGEMLWEAYLNTEGSPVRAAQRLTERWLKEVGSEVRVVGFGVTGSGREVVGSLLRTCYADGVFVMNEIAAHARGAVSLDPDVDTIFEIGGQDAKYIRLEGGRVVDAAMNEACSAGTGSFIAEQGTKLGGAGIDPIRLGRLALEADQGISLGQHCSVFMAEVIDEAITQGVEREAIVAGLYDSVIQNYLNRVKGARTVGERIFCQGMPFSSDALAAAVARQTGRTVVVPPNPGTIGALGVALLARDERTTSSAEAQTSDEQSLDLHVFLGAQLKSKETFICKSTKGCGEGGNKCRIDRLVTSVNGVDQRFLWGGNCSLYDQGAARKKLPDLAPDPFREREALVDSLLEALPKVKGGPVVALSDEFALKGHLPLFATFFSRLGLNLRVLRHAGTDALKRGIEGGRIPYCAPMQLYHGVWFELAEHEDVEYLFIPMVRTLPRVGDGDSGELCPMVLASPDLVSGVLPPTLARVVRTKIDFDEAGYDGELFLRSMRELARDLGRTERLELALGEAVHAQRAFESECRAIGARALSYCESQGTVPVVVHGRPYTIYNDILNSNVPSILRTLGAVAIPLDCFPVSEDAPSLPHQYWTYTQRNLSAAWHVRKTPGVYSVFCSNYACGPDSFTLHFFSYAMQGKPFAIVETDGHSGDAGTKTRMEAFLYCVDTDRRSQASTRTERTDFAEVDSRSVSWEETRRQNALVLLPRMSENALVAAAALRSEGFRAEALPAATREDVRIGRQYTSGKECAPMMLTLGAILKRVRQLDAAEPVTFFMPTTRGPCRFGVYHSLHKLTFERTGEARRLKVVSPDDTDYYRGMSADFAVRLWLGFATHDLLQAMLHDVRPVELVKGATNALFARYRAELIALMERPSKGQMMKAVWELAGGMWGMRRLLERAAAEFSALKDRSKSLPTVSLVGEIYVRLDPFANDFIIEKLEERGVKVRFAPFTEWLEYTTFLGQERVRSGRVLPGDNALTTSLTGLVQRVTSKVLWDTCASALGWGHRTTVEQAVQASLPYIERELEGEATLTLGGPLHEFRAGEIQGVVIVGPHECMPCKIAEAQYGKVSDTENIPYLSVAVTGDPIDTELLDRFTYDVQSFFGRLKSGKTSLPVVQSHPTLTGCAGAGGAGVRLAVHRHAEAGPHGAGSQVADAE